MFQTSWDRGNIRLGELNTGKQVYWYQIGYQLSILKVNLQLNYTASQLLWGESGLHTVNLKIQKKWPQGL